MRLIVISYWVPDAQQKEFRDSVAALGGTVEFYPGTCFLLIDNPDPKLVEEINGHLQAFRMSGNFVIVWDYATSTSSATIGSPMIDWIKQVKDDNPDPVEIAIEDIKRKAKEEMDALKEQMLKKTKERIDEMVIKEVDYWRQKASHS